MNTKEIISQYRSDGYVVIRKLLTMDIVRSIKENIDNVLKLSPDGLLVSYEREQNSVENTSDHKQSARKIRNVGNHSNFIRYQCTKGVLPRIAKTFLGEPIGFYGDQVLFKPAKVGSAKPLHQDIAYFRIDPPSAVLTIWCSLDHATETNGCMRYLVGSHMSGIHGHKKIANTSHLTCGVPNSSLVSVPTEAGDCIVHSSTILHETQNNNSDLPRMALLAHYVRMDAQFPPRSSNAIPIEQV